MNLKYLKKTNRKNNTNISWRIAFFRYRFSGISDNVSKLNGANFCCEIDYFFTEKIFNTNITTKKSVLLCLVGFTLFVLGSNCTSQIAQLLV